MDELAWREIEGMVFFLAQADVVAATSERSEWREHVPETWRVHGAQVLRCCDARHGETCVSEVSNTSWDSIEEIWAAPR